MGKTVKKQAIIKIANNYFVLVKIARNQIDSPCRLCDLAPNGIRKMPLCYHLKSGEKTKIRSCIDCGESKTHRYYYRNLLSTYRAAALLEAKRILKEMAKLHPKSKRIENWILKYGFHNLHDYEVPAFSTEDYRKLRDTLTEIKITEKKRKVSV